MELDKQKSDPPAIPKFDILPGIGLCRKIGEIIRFVIFFPNDSTIYDNTGAAATLDRALYDEEQLTLWNSPEL